MSIDRFGIVASFEAKPGAGDRLADLLTRAAEPLATNHGCELHVVSRSLDDQDVWVTEVWRNREVHQASLEDASVRELVSEAQSLIAGFKDRYEPLPWGGRPPREVHPMRGRER